MFAQGRQNFMEFLLGNEISSVATFAFFVLIGNVGSKEMYQNPVVDIHYDSDGNTVAPLESIPYHTAPEAGYSLPHDTSSSFDSLRAFSTGSTNAFIQRRLFNTSCALTVPLFSFTLPQRASQGTSIDLSNQMIFGLFGLLVTVLVFAVPVVFTGTRPAGITGKSNLDTSSNTLDHLMNAEHVMNFMGADLKNKIGLDPTKCMQKTICEAHRSPKSYGLFGLPLRIFFPPPSDKLPASTVSLFQMAAKVGKTSKEDCGRAYSCFFDILDLVMYLFDWWWQPSPLDYTTTTQI